MLNWIYKADSKGYIVGKEEKPDNFNIELTPSVEEGPYYKPGSPERSNITEPGTGGKKLVI